MEFALLEYWPKDASGTPEKSALLCTEVDIPGSVTAVCPMLESFGFPYCTKRPGVGEYIHLLWGRSVTSGVEIYVPASRLAEAKELLAAPPILEDEPFVENEEPED